MAISSQKLLPGSSDSGAITSIKSSAITKIKPISFGTSTEEASGRKIPEIKKKVIEIGKFLEGSVAAEKKNLEKERKQKQKLLSAGKEEELEKEPGKKEKKKGGIKAPKIGFFDSIKKFIMTTLLGFVLFRLIEFAPLLKKIVPFIAGTIEFVGNVLMGIIDGLGTFLSWGFTAYEDARTKLEEWGGEEAIARFDALGDALGNLFNAIAIVGMTTAAVSPRGPKKGPGKGPGKGGVPSGGPTRKGINFRRSRITGDTFSSGSKLSAARIERLSQAGKLTFDGKGVTDMGYQQRKGQRDVIKKYFNKFGRQKAIDRFGADTIKELGGKYSRSTSTNFARNASVKLLGRRGAGKAAGFLNKASLKAIKGGFGKIPILGPIVVAVSSLLAGQPIGQALFKAVGAAIGGLLGTAIPIPILGTMLGEVLGAFVGDLLYELILGKGAGEALRKLTNAVKTALDVGGLIVNFFKEGFGRFIKQVFEKDPVTIPSGAGRRVAATKIVEFLNMKDFLRQRGYIDNKDQVTKFPNILNLVNPFAYIPMLGAAFFPKIFGQVQSPALVPGKVKEEPKPKGRQGNVTRMIAGPQSGLEDTTDVTASGAGGKGMITGPAGYDRIGAGAAYHVDTKFHKSIGMSGMISAMDQMATAYAAKGKEMVFSGAGSARLQAYTSGLDTERKKSLLNSAIDAHSHSTFMRAQGFLPFDYYIPDKGIRDLYHPSTEKAEILLPTFGGKTNVGSLYGGYGKSANIYDSAGKHVAMTGHGDLAYSKGGFTQSGAHQITVGEEGREFVLDADSTRALEGTFPGLLKALNKADGNQALAILSSYADYEMAEVVPVVVEKPVMVPMPMGGGEDRANVIPRTITSGRSFSDILYKGG